MAKPVIFVIGASGNIGTATVSVLSAKHSDKFDIRAGVRNPEKADKLKLPGVSVVQAQMGDKDKLKETLKGVDALYIIAPGSTDTPENKADLIIATAEAAKEAGVKFLLVLSGHLNDPIIGHLFNKMEAKVSQLGVPHCFIYLYFFFENYFGNKDTIQSQSAIYGPSLPDKPFGGVAVEDAGKASAAILSDYSKHVDKSYYIASDRYTNNELAAAFTEALGKEIKYVQVPYDDTRKALMGMGIQDWQASCLLELYKRIDSGAPEMSQADISVYKNITGEDPTSLKAWIAKYAAAFK